MLSLEIILLITSILLLLSIFASKISSKLSVPTLLLFLGIGMLAGSEGIGGIFFDDAQLAQSIGVIALVFILFSGGLDTPFAAVKPILRRGLVLATFGVLVTAAVVALGAIILLQLSPTQAILLGAIVASTDAAAVFSIFRTQRIGLKGDTIPLLEFESGSNDPMAIFLTIGAIALISIPNTSILNVVIIFIQQVVIGGVLGFGLGYLASKFINNLQLDANGLYPVFTIALVLLAYSLPAALGGSGFLAVYLVGLMLGAQNIVHKNSLSRFHDSIAWLMQIVMFLVLGLLVFPSELLAIAPIGIGISLILIFVARPLSVFIALFRSQFSTREKLLISWVGLRGATPIVLATFPLLAGVPQSDTIFNIVFFVVLSSVLLQGTTIIPVARWLQVTTPFVAKSGIRLERTGDMQIKSDLIEITVPDYSTVIGHKIVDLGLPEDSLIVLIVRGQEAVVPNGSTVLQANDQLLMMADKPSLAPITKLIQSTEVRSGVNP
ncbi:MAG: potassium/proton antiporter [Anaerolineae bacterium]|nr:potassium/proton antiporter [Anaerolineae bacterium]